MCLGRNSAAAKKTATSAAPSDISTKSTPLQECIRRPGGAVDEIEMSGVFSASTTDVLSLNESVQ